MAWRLLDFQSHSIFENMAIDEAIFRETIKNNKQPTIRFYGSIPSAVSIGYFQDAAGELNIAQCRRAKIDIARRITGGKAVFHFNEITYAVTAGDHEKIFPADIAGTYNIISKCIARGLDGLGIRASLAGNGRSQMKEEAGPCCFSSPSKNELLVSGRKICGSAQVRKRGGFLQHGLLFKTFDPGRIAQLLLPARTPEQMEKIRRSVTSLNDELGCEIDEKEICAKIRKGFIEELGIDLQEGDLTSAEEKLKKELIQKYNDDSWNIERKKYFKAA